MMGFDIQDGKEYLPPEEDIYDVNSIEEQERFNALLGIKEFNQEARLHRRKALMVVVAAVLLVIMLATLWTDLTKLLGF